ncbi:unnamed protein product [Rotaria sordida]|uniref:RanBP2-type domain-containing protein n=1 Tax=Rotaria sordida TaxID=392033 RepID=A0A814U4A1_9BILA|nr:unnamed protein product [Rotaria sordida]CAF1241094.1 unnamed protein product [Rotaria sordida]CAF4038533.1 unnamed protein product [Rotaria sordida]
MELAYLMGFQRVLVSFCKSPVCIACSSHGQNINVIRYLVLCHGPNPPTADNRLSYTDLDDQRDLASKLFQWQCPRCTFLNNDSFRICEMCSCGKGS